MPINSLDFISTAYKQPALQLNQQNCVNWYGTIDQTGKTPKSLQPFPGSTLWGNDSNNHVVRGLYELNNIQYAVVDNEFRSYDYNGNYKKIGTLKSSVGRISFIANDNQIAIMDGSDGYVYQLVTTATRTAGDFFVIDEASSYISTPVFQGAGLDDMDSSGTYTGATDKKYKVEIDGTGTPDTFRWSDTDGQVWNQSNVQITASAQTLNDGVQVIFDHTTGHTRNDLWVFDATDDNSFYPPLIGAYIDNFGVYIKQRSHRFYLSSINDFSVVNALEYAQANAFPDNIVSVAVVRQELILFCRDTTEIRYYTGNPDFPLQRRSGFLNTYGCEAPYSLAIGDNSNIFWLARNKDGGRIVMLMVGYEPEMISTEPLNAELQTYSKVDDSFGFVQQWDGHIFYYLTFPSEDKTWVFDKTTKQWFERSTRRLSGSNLNPNEYIEGRYRANCYCYFNGLHLIGDYKTGKIFILDRYAYQDYDEDIICEATTRHFTEKNQRIDINWLELDFEKGRADITGLESDPQVMLKVSKDGRSFGKEIWRSIGKRGEYNRRVKWSVLGSARTWMFRLRISAKLFRVFLGANADMELDED